MWKGVRCKPGTQEGGAESQQACNLRSTSGVSAPVLFFESDPKMTHEDYQAIRRELDRCFGHGEEPSIYDVLRILSDLVDKLEKSEKKET